MLTSSKAYSLRKGPSSEFPFIGFSLNKERPEVFLPKIEKELKRKAFQGNVLIDTLACNGDSSRRFFLVYFDGSRLVYAKTVILPKNKIDESTRVFCSKFYSAKSDELKKSVLTPVQRYKLQYSES